MTLFMFVCIYFGIWNRGISCIGTHDEGYTGKKNPLKLQHPLAPDETSVCVWNKRASLSLSLSHTEEQKAFFFPPPSSSLSAINSDVPWGGEKEA